ncbi:DUF192 domain-containing protein [Paraglaciecola aquimarina]|uniref:DUF192 domain-containing protein n=1 Tax=Paraglaciecola aquimarina TaxID=1235557 RepID=A0ABU3SWV1_9ALTE|nr:DUF192 domain-containing protein [Paraglaciecola aquimarina]MDU0354484.1 DUF192 domain-containing protein [Paraglaciecola aquimarina]
MFNKMSVRAFVVFVWLMMLVLPVRAGGVVFSDVKVAVNQQTYLLEYATSFEQRAQGLMHRESLCNSCGMLFNFQKTRAVNMWMKNTLVPLDVAFIRADGFIVNIEAMQPHDLATTSSSGDVLYAWEMNQGWFAKNGIAVGDSITIIEK